ncbi:MAG: hypothetical protein IKK12_03055, partial [Clostridia bacterium]|nr:hypothetical protein [Clostridia bacterium]
MNYISKNKKQPHNCDCFLLACLEGFPPALGQCRRQPGVLKNHSPDGFSPPHAAAAPFESLNALITQTKNGHHKMSVFCLRALRDSRRHWGSAAA